MFVLHYVWRKRWYFILPFGIFLIIDLYTFSSNALKVPSGGWVAILIGPGFFILGFCWFFGQLRLRRFLKNHAATTGLKMLPARLGLLVQNSRQNSRVSLSDIPILFTANRSEPDNISCSDSDSNVDFDTHDSGTLPRVRSFVQLVESVKIAPSSVTSFNVELSNSNTNDVISAVVTPGVACFLTISKKHTPHVFESFLSHMHSVPQVIIFLKIEHTKRAIINNNQRLTVKVYGDNIYHVTALYGYTEYRIKPFEILLLARAQHNVPIPDNEFQVTVFVSNETIKILTIGWRSWIRRWPLYIYSVLKSLYPGAAVNIELNPENTISIGILADLD
ncbi:unnamed protein product [Rotaria socialis]|nr:unnamed protein product [Rotaria socialis]